MEVMDRRHFLALAAVVSSSAVIGRAAFVSATVSVVEFGADPTGKSDSTSGIQNAITQLTKTGARKLVFPSGTYRINSAQHIALTFNDCSDLEIEGSGSTLLMGVDAVCLACYRCSNVSFHNLTIDFDPLPFTQGVVSASGPGSFDLKVDGGFPVPSNPLLLALNNYDRGLKNVAGHLVERYGGEVSQVQSIGDRQLRVQASNLSPMPEGTVVVLRFKGNHDVIRITRSHNVLFSGVKVLSGYSVAFNAYYCSDLSFRQCSVGLPPSSSRLLSTDADGMNINWCSGFLRIDQCTFQSTGDDAINIKCSMWRAQQNPNGGDMALVTHANAVMSKDDVQSGDQLEVLDPADLHVIARESVALSSGTELASRIPKGAFVDDLNLVPETTVTNCQFLGNRGRAIVAHANLKISNCSFQNLNLAAILIAPDSHYMEGPSTSNVVIDSNHFSGCHYTSQDPEGTVTVDLEHTYGRRKQVPKAIAHNVKITNNTFMDCYTAAISCRSVDGLRIEGNQIGRTWVGSGNGAHSAILVSELTNSTISGNTSTARNAIVVRNSESTTVDGNQGFST